MQPLTSDSELDLTPSPACLPSFYLRCPRARLLYHSLRDGTVPLTPRTATHSTSSSLSSPPRSPVCAPPSESNEVPNSGSVDVVPPSDEQLGLPSAIDAAVDDIPIAIKPLALALWKAPQLAVLHDYTRQQVATALAHALNLHRANGDARAVLIVPRVKSNAKQWQQKLSVALDEVKLTTLRNACQRSTVLNSLRTEQSPGVVILGDDKSWKDAASWNEMLQALKENRVVNTWDLVISEIRGGDSTLNLHHSPFRMVADKRARAGMFVMCSNELPKVQQAQFSKLAVRDFVQTQFPSLAALQESVWINRDSVGSLPTFAKKPGRASVEGLRVAPRVSTRSMPRSKPQELEHLRRTADELVAEIERSPPLYQQKPSKGFDEEDMHKTTPIYQHIPPEEVGEEDLHFSQLARRVERVTHMENVPRSLFLPVSTLRARNETAAGRAPLQEKRKPTNAKRERRTSSSVRSNQRVSSSHNIATMRSTVGRTRRRSSSEDIQTRDGYDRRSVSIVELSDEDESELEWHTPPSQLVVPPFYSNNSEGENDSSDDETWKTAYASRRKSRISTDHRARSRARSRNPQLSNGRQRSGGGRHDSEFMFPGRRGRRPSCALDAGDESPDTFPSTNVPESEASAQGTSTGSGKRCSVGSRIRRGRRVSNEQCFGKRLGHRRSTSAQNFLDTEEATPINSPLETTQRRNNNSTSANSSRDEGLNKHNVRRNMSFIEILDSDIEVVDADPEVIDLCSDDDDIVPDEFSPARNIELKRAHRISKEHANMRTADDENQDEGDISCDSSLILTGVTKYNPQPGSLTVPERQKYNTWLRKARRAEARGPDGYDEAIKLYTKCLALCDEDDHLASRILSLSHETGVLSMKDFYERPKPSQISKRTRPPRRRLRRLCSSDSSS